MHELHVALRKMSPERRRYALQFLPVHLAGAGQTQRLSQLLTTFDFLQATHDALGPKALIDDYDLSGAQNLRLIQQAIRISSHILSQDKSQLAGQLLGRLWPQDGPEIQVLLEQAKAPRVVPWLRPLGPSLIPAGGALVRTLTGHTAPVLALAISPNGRRLISAAEDHTLRVWDLETAAEEFVLRGHTREIRAVTVTPDGRRVISVSEGGTLIVWDLETKAAIQTLEGYWPVTLIPPEGRSFLARTSDWKAFTVWDPESGKARLTLAGHTAYVTAVAVTTDGRYAVSASMDYTLRIWDLERGRVVRVLRGHYLGVTQVAITPDDRYVISTSIDGTLRIWPLQRSLSARLVPAVLRFFLAPAYKNTPMGGYYYPSIFDAIFGYDRLVRWLASRWPDFRPGLEGRSEFWSLEYADEPSRSRFLPYRERHTMGSLILAITPDGRRAIVAARQLYKTMAILTNSVTNPQYPLRVWDIETGTLLATLWGHTAGVTALCLTPDGKRLVSASEDRTLIVWDLAAGKALRTLSGHTANITAVGVTPDGQSVISASEDHTLNVWDLSRQIHPTQPGHTAAVRAIAVTSDGRHAVSASDDHTLRVWDLRPDGEAACSVLDEPRFHDSHAGNITAVAASRDRRRVVTAGQLLEDTFAGQAGEGPILETSGAVNEDGFNFPGDRYVIKVWDLNTRKVVDRLNIPEGDVLDLTVTGTGQKVIAALSNGSLIVWNVARKRGSLLRAHSQPVNGVAVVPDGRHAISASGDHSLAVWNLRNQTRASRLTGHTASVNAVAVTSDGEYAISASDDQTLKVWRWADGENVLTLHGHSAPVLAVAVTPHGRQVVSASADHTVRVWDLNSRRVMASFVGDSPMYACAVTPDGATVIAGEESGRVHFLRLEGCDLIASGEVAQLSGRSLEDERFS